MKIGQVNISPDPLLQTEVENIYRCLQGNVSFGDTLFQKGENIDAYIVSATANVASGNDITLTHALGRIPQYFIILGNTASGTIYNGSGTNSTSNFFIKYTAQDAKLTIALC